MNFENDYDYQMGDYIKASDFSYWITIPTENQFLLFKSLLKRYQSLSREYQLHKNTYEKQKDIENIFEKLKKFEMDEEDTKRMKKEEEDRLKEEKEKQKVYERLSRRKINWWGNLDIYEKIEKMKLKQKEEEEENILSKDVEEEVKLVKKKLVADGPNPFLMAMYNKVNETKKKEMEINYNEKLKEMKEKFEDFCKRKDNNKTQFDNDKKEMTNKIRQLINGEDNKIEEYEKYIKRQFQLNLRDKNYSEALNIQKIDNIKLNKLKNETDEKEKQKLIDYFENKIYNEKEGISKNSDDILVFRTPPREYKNEVEQIFKSDIELNKRVMEKEKKIQSLNFTNRSTELFKNYDNAITETILEDAEKNPELLQLKRNSILQQYNINEEKIKKFKIKENLIKRKSMIQKERRRLEKEQRGKYDIKMLRQYLYTRDTERKTIEQIYRDLKDKVDKRDLNKLLNILDKNGEIGKGKQRVIIYKEKIKENINNEENPYEDEFNIEN